MGPLTASDLFTDVCRAQGYSPSSPEGRYALCAVTSNMNNWHTAPAIPACYASNSPSSHKARRQARRAFEAAVRARNYALKRAAVAEHAEKCGFDPKEALAKLTLKEEAGIVAGIVIWIVGGPLMLFITVICASTEWIVQQDLSDRYGPQAIARCAAEYRSE